MTLKACGQDSRTMLENPRVNIVYNLLLIFLHVCNYEARTTSNTTKLLNDDCQLINGRTGSCMPLKDCPSALGIILYPEWIEPCGTYKSEPIICCDVIKKLKKPSSISVGTISKQVCNETYFGLYPIVKDLPLIVGSGGVDALAHEYLHMAVLGYGTWPYATWGCGGSLISEKFILTAAHCIETSGLGQVKFVRVGDLDLHRSTDKAEPQDFNVSRIIIHPEYHPPSVYNDIALIELDKEFVMPACLNTELSVGDYNRWVATGWGVTSYDGNQADHLQEMILRNFSHKECQDFFQNNKRRMNHGINITTQLCAGHPTMDTCQGDSGGPLQIRNPNHRIGYTVIGITSFGKPCGLTKAPGVYTRVSHYIGWIESIVWPQGV